MRQIVSWVHFGDLHIAGGDEQNYRDLLELIDEVNGNAVEGMDFAILPGDNADDGEEEEYRLVKAAIARCRIPVHTITGDHDVAAGRLDLYRKYLGESLYKSFERGGYRFLFLNSVAQWRPPEFGLGSEQMKWLRSELGEGPSVVFMHAYPSEHGMDAAELRRLFREHSVLLVEMGHTHYNELGNDGRTVYAATRSTGQIEEGPAGFSVTTLDDGVVSWKFKPIGEWPLVMVTSPADERLIVDERNPAQVVRGAVQVRARVWGNSVEDVTLSINDGTGVAMEAMDGCTWGAVWDTDRMKNGLQMLRVRARTSDGRTADDCIRAWVDREGTYEAPARRDVDYENAFGAWPEKHILGTQLGPNENGHAWPPKHERVAR